jgi:hypothetical protein
MGLMKKIICPKCNDFIPEYARECPHCHSINDSSSRKRDNAAAEEKPTSSLVYCDLCGKKGRKIEIDQGKNKKPLVYYRCFECHEQETIGKQDADWQEKGYDLKPNRQKINPIYRKYLEALREHHTKPMFYGEQPHWDIIKPLEDDWAMEQLTEAKRIRSANNASS